MFRLLYENIEKKLNELLDCFNETKEIQDKSFENKKILYLSNNESIKLNASIPYQTETKTEQSKTLSDIITHQNSIEIVESLKIQYKNIKGKRLKLLLMALQDLKLLPKERVAQKFYDCCKKEFDWNIASYTAMNGYNYNEVTDSIESANMKQHIESLIKTK